MQPGLASERPPLSYRYNALSYLLASPMPTLLAATARRRGGIIIIIPFPDSKCIRHCGQNERAEEMGGQFLATEKLRGGHEQEALSN